MEVYPNSAPPIPLPFFATAIRQCRKVSGVVACEVYTRPNKPHLILYAIGCFISHDIPLLFLWLAYEGKLYNDYSASEYCLLQDYRDTSI